MLSIVPQHLSDRQKTYFYRLPLGKSLLAIDWLTSSSQASLLSMLAMLSSTMLCNAVDAPKWHGNYVGNNS